MKMAADCRPVRPGYISITQFNVSPKLIFRQFIKHTKLMLPRKRFWITISLRKNWKEDEALQFPFEALVHVVSFEQAILWIGVEVDRDRVFEGALKLLLQILNKVCYPAVEVIVVTVRYKYIVLKSGY